MSVCCSIDKDSVNPTKMITYLDLSKSIKYGGKVKLLVDTGATHTIVSLSDIIIKSYSSKCKSDIVTEIESNFEFVSGKGITSKVKYFLLRIPEVKIGETIYTNFVIGVVPAFTKYEHGLLGSSFVYSHDIHFNKNDTTLTLMNCDYTLYQKYLMVSCKVYELQDLANIVNKCSNGAGNKLRNPYR